MKLGLVQMTSAASFAPNIAFMREMVAEAAGQGCEIIAFPEVAGLMNRRIEAMRADIRDEGSDPFIAACKSAAREHGIWVHTGSTPVLSESETRFFNHSNLIDDSGQVIASYDKIHLFDYTPLEGKPILESKRYAPGHKAVLADTPWGKLGLSICYDLRFPALYRHYAKSGAGMLFIPSAFTIPTGRAHWEVLLRARAIENGAFVIASAQVGEHEDGRETYGHAMVVDPWGNVVADMGKRIGLHTVELDLSLVGKARSQIPSLTHDQAFER